MKGDNCVSIGADRRFGVQMQTISTNYLKIYQLSPHLYLTCAGLITDCQTVFELARFRKNMYELQEQRKIKPKVFAAMLSHMLYEKHFSPFYVEPIVAGLDSTTYEPYVCAMDSLGCITATQDFVVGGTAAKQLYGMCEAVWEPNLKPDELFEVTSQALINAFDRDALSGGGATVFLMYLLE